MTPTAMLLAIPFPHVDPVALQIGPIAIRWYALAYIAGLAIGWAVLRKVAARPPKVATPQQVDDFLTWAALGTILGGRLGYVLFYKPGFYLSNPLSILTVWEGGMSFHGGFLGVVIAAWLYSRRIGADKWMFGDAIALVAPIGLFFGRLANFINGELWGRVSDVPWAMVFPTGGPNPRHPSQLYQAGLEGAALFALMLVLLALGARRRPGLMTGAMFAGYGAARSVGELWRQPDAHLGFLLGGATMGQLLSIPMILVGGWLIARALRNPPAPA